MINPNAETNLKRFFQYMKEFVLSQFATCSSWLLYLYNTSDVLWMVVMFTSPNGQETEMECEQQMIEWIKSEADKIINFDEERNEK